MNVPYNTGKVKIGEFYQRPPPVYDQDKDMVLLQTSLIGDVKAIKKEKLYNKLYVGTLVFGVFGAILLAKN
jgi:hypothetical protein